MDENKKILPINAMKLDYSFKDKIRQKEFTFGTEQSLAKIIGNYKLSDNYKNDKK